MAINAFSLTWNNNYFFTFPPFSFVGRVLAKIKRDKTNAVIVVYTRLVNPILVPTVATDDQPGPIVFSAVKNKFDIAT